VNGAVNADQIFPLRFYAPGSSGTRRPFYEGIAILNELSSASFCTWRMITKKSSTNTIPTPTAARMTGSAVDKSVKRNAGPVNPSRKLIRFAAKKVEKGVGSIKVAIEIGLMPSVASAPMNVMMFAPQKSNLPDGNVPKGFQ
jgi:hypothetical protein